MRGSVSVATIKKEIITLRTCWNWGIQFGLIEGKFPNRGIRFAKMDEKPPFQTIAEVERKIATSALSPKQIAELWDAVFLTVPEIAKLLAYVKEHATLPWVYPHGLRVKTHPNYCEPLDSVKGLGLRCAMHG